MKRFQRSLADGDETGRRPFQTPLPMDEDSLYEPLGQYSPFGTPLSFLRGLQRSIVKVVFVVDGGCS